VKTKQSGLSTRDQIIAAARELFARDGYAATSTEQVLQRTGISRGALYHHFRNKESLFEAVLDDLERELAGAAARAATAASDPVAALRAGCASFLIEAAKPEVRQIVLVDAHSVVGWQKWREIEERYGLGMLKQGLKAIAAEHEIPGQAVELYAHILLAAMIEVAFLVSRSPDPTEAAADAWKMIDGLLDRLLPSPVKTTTP
jgi:AcrR family transcriptional regulator